MKKRITALLIMLAAIVLLSACSAGMHSDLEVSSTTTTTNPSFSESNDETCEETKSQTESSEAAIIPTTDTAQENTLPTEKETAPESIAETPQASQTENADAAENTEETITVKETPETNQEQTNTPKSTQEPIQTPKPTTEPTKEPTPEPQPKSIYEAPFDVEAIRQELIAIGESQGLTHTDGKTPSDSGWASPVIASESFQGASLERGLKDYVRSMPEMIVAYGGQPIQFFTIYVEPLGGGKYQFYFLY